MSDLIHLLPDHIANQIAAGEVINRPASVVKELVENAIDAHATDIKVYIEDAGKTLIQVIDNGIGMSETDARMAFERHATSKITKVDDLYSLQTMGFRGEALASIASVAQVELRTRMKGKDVGICLELADANVVKVEDVVCQEGSTFKVKNLFYNVPARRKFLKSEKTEFRNISTEFERIALVNPQVAISLYHNNVLIKDLPISGRRQRIINICGKALNQKMLSVEANSTLINISGYVGRPDSVKKSGASQYFFVNGRFMKHPYFHKAVMQAYEQLIPTGGIPDYFLYFELRPSNIDVNVHPTKTEIKFENEQPIWQIIMAAIREALAKSSSIPTIDFNQEDTLNIPIYTPISPVSKEEPKDNYTNHHTRSTSYNPFTTPVSHEIELNIDGNDFTPNFEWEQLCNDFEEETPPSETTKTEQEKQGTLFEANEQTSNANTSFMQYGGQYILTPLASGIALIDQRRAHLRILYDQYVEILDQKRGTSQQVLFPEVVQYTKKEDTFLQEVWENLIHIGYELTPLGGESYAVAGIPSSLTIGQAISVLNQTLETSMGKDSKFKDTFNHHLALTMSKALCMSQEKRLSQEEMEHIVASIFSCPDSTFSPDGKLILSIITDEELNKRFK